MEEKLKKIFSEEEVKNILNMKSGDVTFDMLSQGQKRAFVAIATQIKRNMNNELNPEMKGGMTLEEMFSVKKKHITLNGPAGTK